MTSWHGILFNSGDKFWSNLRRFAYHNRTLLEVLFIGIYALEQASLIWFTYKAGSLEELSYVISVFAIIVLTTFSLHKLLMESRIKCLEREVNELQQNKSELGYKVKVAQKDYQELYEVIQEKHSKNLNSLLDLVKKKEG